MNENAIYSDGLVTITSDALVFHNYYFPFGNKTVPLSDIERINEYEPTMMNGKWRLWGTGGAYAWFPLDIRRPSRDRIFYISLKNTAFRIGFSVKDSIKVQKIFEQMHLMG